MVVGNCRPQKHKIAVQGWTVLSEQGTRLLDRDVSRFLRNCFELCANSKQLSSTKAQDRCAGLKWFCLYRAPDFAKFTSINVL